MNSGCNFTNLGLALRPDLFDAHTVHWHGFRNVIPFFDGEPTGSVSVPTGRDFTYVYRPREAGTYMFHCHVEDTEHVHMGMTGLVFVRPLQDGKTSRYPSGKYAYNDGDGSTGYDREFAMFLSEVWAESHWADSHIQLPEWSDYRADFSMLNGRVYPDTLAPNSPIGALNPFMPWSVETDANGDLVPTPGYEHLQYQPALLPGDLQRRRTGAVALRQPGLQGIGHDPGGHPDACRRPGCHPDCTGVTARIPATKPTPSFGAGESFDVIFTAPAFSGGSGSSGSGYDSYLLYNREYTRSNNLASGGFGGQTTEVHVYPGGVAAQGYPNDLGGAG